jgi:CheY-like chemotaxis protein
MKILIVDDEIEILELLSDDLQSLGFETIMVSSIHEAEYLLQGCNYVFIDKMDGSFEFAKKSKALGIKTISFTGYNKISPEHEHAFDGYLHKPWEDDDLKKLFE